MLQVSEYSFLFTRSRSSFGKRTQSEFDRAISWAWCAYIYSVYTQPYIISLGTLDHTKISNHSLCSWEYAWTVYLWYSPPPPPPKKKKKKKKRKKDSLPTIGDAFSNKQSSSRYSSVYICCKFQEQNTVCYSSETSGYILARKLPIRPFFHMLFIYILSCQQLMS